MGAEKIRNFCIVAHIDHGKSTLADRVLEITGAIEPRQFREQFLDRHEIERERGITIKAKAVALNYKDYTLNLIDTPGHVDFSYEVAKSLAACEGALLIVDASQGVQAQTVANAYLAIEQRLRIVPVVNKIDLQYARIDDAVAQLTALVGSKKEEILLISAKDGTGVANLMDQIISRINPPKGDENAPLRALIFDSLYDEYHGVIIYVRIIDGEIKKGDEIMFLSNERIYEVGGVGICTPDMRPVEGLCAGSVGYLMANIKSIRDVKIGDTITSQNVDVIPLPGYKEPIPMVFCEFYPAGDTSYEDLKKAIERLSLNDASFRFQPQTSDALGAGFHCGFLGLLHMEIIQERLEREGQIQIVKTAPQLTYEVLTKDSVIRIDNPNKIPDEDRIIEWREPYVDLKVVTPAECIGSIMKLCGSRRGEFIKQDYISPTRVVLSYDIPFAEIVYDFHDKLKSVSHGYATMDYTFIDFFPSDLVRLKIIVAGKQIDALSIITHKSKAEYVGRRMLRILRKEIPRHLFEISLQASIGKKIIARENIRAIAKFVTGKCYGGDYTRKMKLIERVKEGKKRLKAVGRVEIPQEAFMAVLKASEDQEIS